MEVIFRAIAAFPTMTSHIFMTLVPLHDGSEQLYEIGLSLHSRSQQVWGFLVLLLCGTAYNYTFVRSIHSKEILFTGWNKYLYLH